MSQASDAKLRVGRQLAARREELELTQTDVGRVAEVSSTTVSAIERGKNEIRRTARRRWEAALHLHPGTITRAYRDGTPLEPAPGVEFARLPSAYADLGDEHEAAVWAMQGISEADRRTLIDILRAARALERHRQGA